MSQTLFLIISVLGLVAAAATVLARNLVHAALALVAFFFLVACQFVLLEAEFMAAMQVLVYIGAVAIILMFGIMLTRNIQGDETTGGHWSRLVVPGLLSLGVFAILALGIRREAGTPNQPAWSHMLARPPVSAESPNLPLPPRAPAVNNMGKVIGDEMMTRFVVPFELAGLLLTAAVVGAVAIAMRDPSRDESGLEPIPATTADGRSDGDPARRPRTPTAPATETTPASSTVPASVR